VIEVLTDRLAGLTDEEYLWQPAGGRNLVETEVWAPSGEAGPPRTIAWSMGHREGVPPRLRYEIAGQAGPFVCPAATLGRCRADLARINAVGIERDRWQSIARRCQTVGRTE